MWNNGHYECVVIIYYYDTPLDHISSRHRENIVINIHDKHHYTDLLPWHMFGEASLWSRETKCLFSLLFLFNIPGVSQWQPDNILIKFQQQLKLRSLPIRNTKMTSPFMLFIEWYELTVRNWSSLRAVFGQEDLGWGLDYKRFIRTFFRRITFFIENVWPESSLEQRPQHSHFTYDLCMSILVPSHSLTMTSVFSRSILHIRSDLNTVSSECIYSFLTLLSLIILDDCFLVRCDLLAHEADPDVVRDWRIAFLPSFFKLHHWWLRMCPALSFSTYLSPSPMMLLHRHWALVTITPCVSNSEQRFTTVPSFPHILEGRVLWPFLNL